VIPKPTAVGDKVDAIDKKIWGKEIGEYIKRKVKHEDNCHTLFFLILGECTDYLNTKLE
jgi:hypothetical protein